MSEQETYVLRLYKELNESLFDGLLPSDYQIIFVPVGECEPDYGDESGSHDGITRTIKLTESLRHRPQALRHNLVHEMVHAAESDKHDEDFFNRLVNIARRGEEWAWDEARDYHPCIVQKTIHRWRKMHPDVQSEDLRL